MFALPHLVHAWAIEWSKQTVHPVGLLMRLVEKRVTLHTCHLHLQGGATTPTTARAHGATSLPGAAAGGGAPALAQGAGTKRAHTDGGEEQQEVSSEQDGSTTGGAANKRLKVGGTSSQVIG